MSTTVAAALAADMMVRAPKVHGPELTVAELHGVFADDHVHMVVLVEGGRLLGTLVRGDVPPGAPPATRALLHAVTEGRTAGPTETVGAVRAAMRAAGVRRLAVVDEGGRLLGLLCLKRDLAG